MIKLKLGDSDLNISPIVFGGNVFGWTLDKKQSFDILDEFVDLGFNAVDTANTYSHWVNGNVGGESEQIIGDWMKSRGNRENMVILTKVGGRLSVDHTPNTQRKHILEQAELSLRRLQTDYIDLYQTHYDDGLTPVDETLRAYEDLIKQGKVRFIGASNISPERLKDSLSVSKAFALPAYTVLQPEYNLYDRFGFESDYEQIVIENELAVIPYYALASGFLTGKYNSEEDFDLYPRGEGIKQRYWNERGVRIVNELSKVAKQLHTSISAVSLAWLLDKKYIVAPIVSGTKSVHLKSFVEAVELRLSAEIVDRLNEVSKQL